MVLLQTMLLSLVHLSIVTMGMVNIAFILVGDLQKYPQRINCKLPLDLGLIIMILVILGSCIIKK